MAISAEHRSKFAALHRQWWHLHMSEKFSSGTIKPKKPNKQTKTLPPLISFWKKLFLSFRCFIYEIKIKHFQSDLTISYCHLRFLFPFFEDLVITNQYLSMEWSKQDKMISMLTGLL